MSDCILPAPRHCLPTSPLYLARNNGIAVLRSSVRPFAFGRQTLRPEVIRGWHRVHPVILVLEEDSARARGG